MDRISQTTHARPPLQEHTETTGQHNSIVDNLRGVVQSFQTRGGTGGELRAHPPKSAYELFTKLRLIDSFGSMTAAINKNLQSSISPVTSDGSLNPVLEKRLSEWTDQAVGTLEYRSRQTAAAMLRSALMGETEIVDLRELGLSSLPRQVISSLPRSVQMVCLNGNNLKSSRLYSVMDQIKIRAKKEDALPCHYVLGCRAEPLGNNVSIFNANEVEIFEERLYSVKEKISVTLELTLSGGKKPMLLFKRMGNSKFFKVASPIARIPLYKPLFQAEKSAFKTMVEKYDKEEQCIVKHHNGSSVTINLKCPISLELPSDPAQMAAVKTGNAIQLYDRAELARWLTTNPTDPTNRTSINEMKFLSQNEVVELLRNYSMQ